MTPVLKGYRYPEGTFATSAAVKYQTEKFIRVKTDELIGLATSLKANPRDTSLQAKAADILRDIHVAQAVFGCRRPPISLRQ